jgi:hypothetical protein
VIRPEPIAPPPPVAPELPEAPRMARPAPAVTRTSPVRVPAAQIDATAARTELPDAVRVVEHRPTSPLATRSAPPPPAVIDRVATAVPKPEMAATAPLPRPAPAPPAAARAARPAGLNQPAPAADRRHGLRGVALSELLPCMSDAREMALKQKTVAAARNASLCESPAGRFHFVETKNVNAFLMSIEMAPGRRSGDRCEELTLALDCLASLPPRSSR